MSSASIPFADVTGKSLEEHNPSCCFNAGEKWVHSMEFLAEMGPVRPISQPDALSLSQDPVGSVSPRSTVKTRELMVSLRRSRSQELSCSRGKSELNLVRNSASERS